MLVTLGPSSKIICIYCLTVIASHIDRLELVLEISTLEALYVSLETLNSLFMVTRYTLMGRFLIFLQ